MALSSAFRGRLEQMEKTRNQRLSLLQAEKELQANKYLLLGSKIANIRSTEQRCLMLDQKIASMKLNASTLKSEIECLDSKYQNYFQQLRVLKTEVDELEALEKEKEKYYGLKTLEMKEFKENVETFSVECRVRVEKLRTQVNKLKSSFTENQENSGYYLNSEIAAAEMKKKELSSLKENLERRLASNYQRRAQLQKQLHIILATQDQERRKLPRSPRSITR